MQYYCWRAKTGHTYLAEEADSDIYNSSLKFLPRLSPNMQWRLYFKIEHEKTKEATRRRLGVAGPLTAHIVKLSDCLVCTKPNGDRRHRCHERTVAIQIEFAPPFSMARHKIRTAITSLPGEAHRQRGREILHALSACVTCGAARIVRRSTRLRLVKRSSSEAHVQALGCHSYWVLAMRHRCERTKASETNPTLVLLF